MKMKKKDIELEDTVRGWLVSVQKYEYKTEWWLSSFEENEKLLKLLKDLCDAAEVLEGKIEETSREKE